MSGSTRSYEMARRMVGRGHEVHIVTSDRKMNPDRGGWRQEDIDGIQVHWLPVPYRNADGHKRRVRSFMRFAFEAISKAHSLSPDLVFASSTPLTVSIPGILAAWSRRVPFVFEARDLWPELPIAVGALKNPVLRSLASALERQSYGRASAIVALSPGIAAGIKAKLNSEKPLAVIPNACDSDLFAPDPEGAKKFRATHPELGQSPLVLYAGTLGRINNLSYLVQVAQHCDQIHGEGGHGQPQGKSPKFVVIGHGAEFDQIRTLAARLGLLGRNFFVYHGVSKLEIVEAYRAASLATSIFADVPEMENNSANKFFNSLASGTPIAINYGGWQADLVKQNEAGLVLNRNPALAAQDILDLLADPLRLHSCADNARKLALAEFDRDALADKLVDLLEASFEEHEASLGGRRSASKNKMAANKAKPRRLQEPSGSNADDQKATAL